MKVETESGRCDFCMVNTPITTINGGLWWICTPCMDLHFDTHMFVGEEE